METEIANLDALFELVELKLAQCRQALEKHFERFSSQEIDSAVGTAETGLNHAREDILEANKKKMIKALANVDANMREAVVSESDLTRNLGFLAEPTASLDSIRHNWLCNLTYRNEFSFEKKIAYSKIYNTKSKITIRTNYWINLKDCNSFIVPISSERLFHTNDVTDMMLICNPKGRVFIQRKVQTKSREKNTKRTYVAFRVFGRFIVGTGVYKRLYTPVYNHVFIEVYDFALHRKAQKQFSLPESSSPVQMRLFSSEHFMHSHPIKGSYKITLYDYDLNEILIFNQNVSDPSGPYYFRHEQICHFTSRHLYLLSYGQLDSPAREMRILDLNTGQEIQRISVPASQFEDVYFDQNPESPRAIVYDKEHGSFLFYELFLNEAIGSLRSSAFKNLRLQFDITFRDNQIFYIKNDKIFII